MQIDWFTYFAQIVNFLVLVLLLRHFLYRPILRAMRARESNLAARFQEAQERAQQAEQERERFLAQRAELEASHAELMIAAEARAAAKRKTMIVEARAEVEEMQARWYDTVAREKMLFLQELRRRVGAQSLEIARQALVELADADLESRVIDSFFSRLHRLDQNARRQLTHEQGPIEQTVTIRTSFELGYDQRQHIVEALQRFYAHVDDIEEIGVRFEQAPELLCGIEMQAGHRHIAWSLRDYLSQLDDQVDELFDREQADEEVVPSASAGMPASDDSAPTPTVEPVS